jgi:Tripartite tricarboxylate transporter family receptor
MMFVDISTTVAMVKEGNLRAVAVTSAARSTLRPDVPTIDETAIKVFDLASWTELLALKFVIENALPDGIWTTLHAGLHGQKAAIALLLELKLGDHVSSKRTLAK